MKKKYISFGLFIVIAVMLLLNNWQSKGWQKTLSQNALPKLTTIKSIEIPEFSPTTGDDYKEFTSPDGKIKIQYPDSWMIVENQGLISASTPKTWQEKYNATILLIAQSLQNGKFAQLILQEGVFNISDAEIINEMKTINQQQGLTMEIVASNTKDTTTVFEAKYLAPNSPNLYSKEEILLIGEKTYLISYITLEKDWTNFGEQADFILQSIKISP